MKYNKKHNKNKRAIMMFCAAGLSLALMSVPEQAGVVFAGNEMSILPSAGVMLTLGGGTDLKTIVEKTTLSTERSDILVSDNIAAGTSVGDKTSDLDAALKEKVSETASKATGEAETGENAKAGENGQSNAEEKKDNDAEGGDAADSGEADSAEVREEADVHPAGDRNRLVIAQADTYVNIRSGPSEEYEVIGKFYNNAAGELIEEKDGWFKISSGNCTGYVKGEYCVSGEDAEALADEVSRKVAIVDADTLNVRESPTTESSVITMAARDDELSFQEESDGWLRVRTGNSTGYVSAEYVRIDTVFARAETLEEETERLRRERETGRSQSQTNAGNGANDAASQIMAAGNVMTPPPVTGTQGNNNTPVRYGSYFDTDVAAARAALAAAPGSEKGKAVVDFALNFVGNPYVYGGSSLTNGADCSGFTMAVYANFGVGMSHSSSAQEAVGYAIPSMDQAEPGDLLIYPGHVALYVGCGKIVHASTSKTGIVISNYSYRPVQAIRRVF